MQHYRRCVCQSQTASVGRAWEIGDVRSPDPDPNVSYLDVALSLL